MEVRSLVTAAGDLARPVVFGIDQCIVPDQHDLHRIDSDAVLLMFLADVSQDFVFVGIETPEHPDNRPGNRCRPRNQQSGCCTGRYDPLWVHGLYPLEPRSEAGNERCQPRPA